MNKFKFHVIGLDHLPARRELTACAFTQKCFKMLRMLLSYGHDVDFYCTEGSDVVFTEKDHIDTGIGFGKLQVVEALPENVRKWTYGEYTDREFYNTYPVSGTQNIARDMFNIECSKIINSNKNDTDFLLLMQGIWHKHIADSSGLKLVVEPSIGYDSAFAPYKVFESYACMHYQYGKIAERNNLGSSYIDSCWTDDVIYASFDIDDFPFNDKLGKTKPLVKNGNQYENYLLFIGRIIQYKGVAIAVKVAEKLNKKLIIAGQGDLSKITTYGDNVIVLDAVGSEDRAELMRNATACFVPTYYVEPFGWVAVEAQLCGTPVITTDWGAFTETVEHGATGYRCHTLDEFTNAVINIHTMDRRYIREQAIKKYSMETIAKLYNDYFSRISIK